MSTIHLIGKIPSLRLTAFMLALTIGMTAIAVSGALIQDPPRETISNATTAEAPSSMDDMKVDGLQRSWSDEWYAVHKALNDRHDDDIQSF